MTGYEAEKQFYIKVSQLRMGGATAAKAADECVELCRIMYADLMYRVGELNFRLNECLRVLHEATGESYESLSMRISMTRPM